VQRSICCALLALMAAGSAGAQAPAAPAGAQVGQDSAVLVVANRPIVTFRAPLGARGPAERASSALARIDAVLDADERGRITARQLPYGYVIAVGGEPLFTVTPADGDLSLEPLERRVIAAQENLSAGLRDYAEQRSVRHLLGAALLAVLATLLFIMALRIIRAARGFLLRRLALRDARTGHVIRDIRAHGFTFLTADHLRVFAKRAVDIIAWVAGLFLAYVWVAYVLTRFAYTRPWGETLGAYLVRTIRELAVGAIEAIPGLFTVVIIFVFARWITRVIGAFFDAVADERVQIPWAHADTAQATKKLVKIGVWVLAIVVAYPYIPGSGTDVFKGVSVLIGVIISLGSSGIVGQAMSGLVLMYSRALKPGEYVRVGETEGTVTKLGMLSTKIRTPKREEITLPNSLMVSSGVRNFTRLSAGEGVIVHTSVTIGYDVPWRQVEALLLLAAQRTPEVARTPEPFVLKSELGDFYVEYQLNAYLTAAELRIPALSQLHANILDAFNEYGVQILSPHYRTDPPVPAIVPPERWHVPPAEPPPER
jgi:small-conductance mechanosensitive channel